MRDSLGDLDAGADSPMARAQAAQRPVRPKRFYKEAGVGPVDGGFAVLLDGRPVRTPARAVLAVPTQALAEALAAEWAAQGEEIDPFSMPLTRLVNVALDRVAPEAAAVREEVANYAGTDLLFYRAEGPDALLERQAAQWDPILEWLNETYGARFFLSEGIRHVAQPDDALARVRARLPQGPLALAALHVITTLTGSALLALALAEGRLDADAVWAAAHVDEDWNRDQWGEDELAAARRAARRIEFDAAVALLKLAPDA